MVSVVPWSAPSMYVLGGFIALAALTCVFGLLVYACLPACLSTLVCSVVVLSDRGWLTDWARGRDESTLASRIYLFWAGLHRPTTSDHSRVVLRTSFRFDDGLVLLFPLCDLLSLLFFFLISVSLPSPSWSILPYRPRTDRRGWSGVRVSRATCGPNCGRCRNRSSCLRHNMRFSVDYMFRPAACVEGGRGRRVVNGNLSIGGSELVG